MDTVLRGQMTDKVFREQLREWAAARMKTNSLVACTCDLDMEPVEVIAGPGNNVRMGMAAYARLNKIKDGFRAVSGSN